MFDRVRENNNLFWESVRDHYLDDFLKSVYADKKKSALIKKWLKKSKSKKLILRQVEYLDHSKRCSDPLLIEFFHERFEISLISEDQATGAEVEVEAPQEMLVFSSSNFIPLVTAWMRRELILKRFLSNARNYFYIARIFYF